MSVILVVQADSSQTRVLRDMAKGIRAELLVVDSTPRAIDAIGRQVPDLILLSTLMSPRDENALMAHLRTLEGAAHLETLTLPQFETAKKALPKQKSGFGFRKKQKAPVVAVGKDPAIFAEEIVSHLARAHEIRTRPAPETRAEAVRPPDVDPMASLVEQWAYESPVLETPAFEDALVSDDLGREEWAVDAPSIEMPAPEPMLTDAPTSVSKDAVATDEDEDEIDKLVRQLGMDVKLIDITDVAPSLMSLDDEANDRTDLGALLAAEEGWENFGLSADVPEATGAGSLQPVRGAEPPSTSERGWGTASADQSATGALSASWLDEFVVNDDELITPVTYDAVTDATGLQRDAEAEALGADLTGATGLSAIARSAEADAAGATGAVPAGWLDEFVVNDDEPIRPVTSDAMTDAGSLQPVRGAEPPSTSADQSPAGALSVDWLDEFVVSDDQLLNPVRDVETVAAVSDDRSETGTSDLSESGIEPALALSAKADATDLSAVARSAEAEADFALSLKEEAIRAAAIAEARAAAEIEAREALAVDLARVQAEAEAMREIAIAEARAVAEREARETMNAELARVRSETEMTVAEALNKVKVEAKEAERARVDAERMRVEAQEAFAAEISRVREEVEQKLSRQLDAARAESEQIRATEAEAARERATAEGELKAELDRLRFVAAQTRRADESETRRAAEQIKHLEEELTRVRVAAEQRQAAELEEIKAQLAEMREAAAQQVRVAAADALAAEMARAALHVVASAPPARPTAVIAQFPTREVVTRQEIAPREVATMHDEQEAAVEDYLSLWQAQPEPVEIETSPVIENTEDRGTSPFSGHNLRRHAKWALPAAACLLLVTNTGTAISTVARFVGPAQPPPALTVEPVELEKPFVEAVKKRVGRLRVEATPAGAEVVVDGRSYGKSPLTIPDLAVGTHTLVLKSGQGSVTRKVVVKANETTQLTQAIFSGWLAIFSPIPVTAVVDGRPVHLTEDGRLMVAPGSRVVELISERFNYRSTQTLEVRPGATTAHTVSLPMASVRVTAPAGAEIRIDGQPAVGVPGEGLSVAVGSHEISATHPELGERRTAVDVAHGALTEVTLRFD